MVSKTNLSKRLQNLPDHIWSMIAEIEMQKGQWMAGSKLESHILMHLKQSILVTSTGASTRIEGAHLSDEDIEKMMRGISVQKFLDRDKQEVRGYYELLKNVFDAWNSIRFRESAIKHFHKELLKYVTKDTLHRGEYKKAENKVVMVNEACESIGTLFDTTPAYLAPFEMQELMEWTEAAFSGKKHHPLLIIANFLVEFLNVHPFLDGNGRLSRILTNLLMLQTGYEYMPYISHEKLIEDNKPEYYLALRKSQKTIKTQRENIQPWLEFFLKLVLEQSKLAVELISKTRIEKILSPKQLIIWQYLNRVLETTAGEIAKNTKIPKPTVNQSLNRLMTLKKIERIGLGRTTRYKKIGG